MSVQTHTKKTADRPNEPATSGDTIPAAVEPPPFGTYHTVCVFMLRKIFLT